MYVCNTGNGGETVVYNHFLHNGNSKQMSREVQEYLLSGRIQNVSHSRAYCISYMYKHMCIYVYVWIYMYMYVCIGATWLIHNDVQEYMLSGRIQNVSHSWAYCIIYMYMYMCIYIYVYLYMFMYVCINMTWFIDHDVQEYLLSGRIQTASHSEVNRTLYISMYTCIHIYIYMCICICIYIHILCIYMHVCIHTCM